MGTIDEFFTKCNEYLGDPATVYNMDEIAIRLDSPNNRTYDSVGTRRVAALTTGHEKARISVAFCASAAGQKLPLVVVIPRKTAIKVSLRVCKNIENFLKSLVK